MNSKWEVTIKKNTTVGRGLVEKKDLISQNNIQYHI